MLSWRVPQRRQVADETRDVWSDFSLHSLNYQWHYMQHRHLAQHTRSHVCKCYTHSYLAALWSTHIITTHCKNIFTICSLLVSSTNSSIIKTKHKCYITHHGKVTAKLAIILQPLPPCAQNICNFAFLLQTSTWHKYMWTQDCHQNRPQWKQ